MKLRVARHTQNLNRMIDFYGRILGLKVLGEFKNHENYNGVFLGIPNAGWYLEFTVSDNPPLHQADDDDLLIFYVASVEEFTTLKNKIIANGIKNVAPKNPYWAKNGITFPDPDGFRIVISLTTG
jgi:catechol 2,3-dioxygenase-like lactoylglutathione lyase family enzyme